jgi:hypothetical protein
MKPQGLSWKRLASLGATAGALASLALPVPVGAEVYIEKSGNIALEARYFADSDSEVQQTGAGLALSLQPKLLVEWNNGADAVTFEPFHRFDGQDEERTHKDIRDLSWEHVGDSFESRIGWRRVFWGVTEFQHLVDVINQTDQVEALDGEDKLGQPMVNLSFARDWGIVDLFVLPLFRERTFPGEDGRFRPALVIDTDDAQYESDEEDKHIDYAVRWSHYFGDFDIGVHAFEGTNREPLLNPQVRGADVVLVPYYAQMTQFGLDLQATIDSWLWKLEAIHRDTEPESYLAAQGGFEYTFYGVFDSNSDLGAIAEYGWDEREEEATGLIQNDLFMGLRLTLNDADDTEFLIGGGHDLDYGSSSVAIEGAKRFGNRIKVSLDGNLFFADNEEDVSLYSVRDDDYLQANLEYYF